MRVRWVLHANGMRMDISLSLIPFGRVSSLGMRTVRMAKPTSASLDSSAALIATPEESVATTDLR